MNISSHSNPLISDTTLSASPAQPAKSTNSSNASSVPGNYQYYSTSSAPEQKTLHSREAVSVLSGNSFSQTLLESLEISRREAGGPEQQMAKLEDEYYVHLGEMESHRRLLSKTSGSRERQLKTRLRKAEPDTGTRLTKKERSRSAKLQQELVALTHGDSMDLSRLDLSDEKLHKILKSCCRPELARLIPDNMLNSLKRWLGSEHSVLDPPRRELIKVLRSPGELRKVIQNNPHLASGDLYNMDDVVFESGSKLPTSYKYTYWDLVEGSNLIKTLCDYSGMTFKGATFPKMNITANFGNCDMSHANFTGSQLINNDFYNTDLTAACFSKCYISCCDFHKATLIGVDYGDIQHISFFDNCLPKSIDLISRELAEYSRRKTGDQATSAMKTRAKMLLDSQRQEEAEAAYDELMHRKSMGVKDFLEIGCPYLNSAMKLDENDREKKAHLAEKAVACFQKGWQVTANTTNFCNHNLLFNVAIEALHETGPAFDWRSVLEEIKSTDTKSTKTLVWMARILAEKQEDQDAMDILLQLVNIPEHHLQDEGMLFHLCKITAGIGLRNKEYLVSALTVLENATTFIWSAYNIYDLDRLGPLAQQDIFGCWLYRLDLLIHSGRFEEASRVAFEMDEAIPGALELFSEQNYKETVAWKEGGEMVAEIIEKIRDTGVVFTTADGLAQTLGSLNASYIRSRLVAELQESGIPSLLLKKSEQT